MNQIPNAELIDIQHIFIQKIRHWLNHSDFSPLWKLSQMQMDLNSFDLALKDGSFRKNIIQAYKELKSKTNER